MDRLKKAILNFGNSDEFDWNVLAKLDAQEEEIAALRSRLAAAETVEVKQDGGVWLSGDAIACVHHQLDVGGRLANQLREMACLHNDAEAEGVTWAMISDWRNGMDRVLRLLPSEPAESDAPLGSQLVEGMEEFTRDVEAGHPVNVRTVERLSKLTDDMEAGRPVKASRITDNKLINSTALRARLVDASDEALRDLRKLFKLLKNEPHLGKRDEIADTILEVLYPDMLMGKVISLPENGPGIRYPNVGEEKKREILDAIRNSAPGDVRAVPNLGQGTHFTFRDHTGNEITAPRSRIYLKKEKYGHCGANVIEQRVHSTWTIGEEEHDRIKAELTGQTS